MKSILFIRAVSVLLAACLAAEPAGSIATGVAGPRAGGRDLFIGSSFALQALAPVAAESGNAKAMPDEGSCIRLAQLAEALVEWKASEPFSLDAESIWKKMEEAVSWQGTSGEEDILDNLLDAIQASTHQSNFTVGALMKSMEGASNQILRLLAGEYVLREGDPNRWKFPDKGEWMRYENPRPLFLLKDLRNTLLARMCASFLEEMCQFPMSIQEVRLAAKAAGAAAIGIWNKRHVLPERYAREDADLVESLTSSPGMRTPEIPRPRAPQPSWRNRLAELPHADVFAKLVHQLQDPGSPHYAFVMAFGDILAHAPRALEFYALNQKSLTDSQRGSAEFFWLNLEFRKRLTLDILDALSVAGLDRIKTLNAGSEVIVNYSGTIDSGERESFSLAMSDLKGYADALPLPHRSKAREEQLTQDARSLRDLLLPLTSGLKIGVRSVSWIAAVGLALSGLARRGYAQTVTSPFHALLRRPSSLSTAKGIVIGIVLSAAIVVAGYVMFRFLAHRRKSPNLTIMRNSSEALLTVPLSDDIEALLKGISMPPPRVQTPLARERYYSGRSARIIKKLADGVPELELLLWRKRLNRVTTGSIMGTGSQDMHRMRSLYALERQISLRIAKSDAAVSGIDQDKIVSAIEGVDALIHELTLGRRKPLLLSAGVDIQDSEGTRLYLQVLNPPPDLTIDQFPARLETVGGRIWKREGEAQKDDVENSWDSETGGSFTLYWVQYRLMPEKIGWVSAWDVIAEPVRDIMRAFKGHFFSTELSNGLDLFLRSGGHFLMFVLAASVLWVAGGQTAAGQNRPGRQTGDTISVQELQAQELRPETREADLAKLKPLTTAWLKLRTEIQMLQLQFRTSLSDLWDLNSSPDFLASPTFYNALVRKRHLQDAIVPLLKELHELGGMSEKDIKSLIKDIPTDLYKEWKKKPAKSGALQPSGSPAKSLSFSA